MNQLIIEISISNIFFIIKKVIVFFNVKQRPKTSDDARKETENPVRPSTSGDIKENVAPNMRLFRGIYILFNISIKHCLLYFY